MVQSADDNSIRKAAHDLLAVIKLGEIRTRYREILKSSGIVPPLTANGAVSAESSPGQDIELF